MGCKPYLVHCIWSYLGGGCSLQFSIIYVTHVFLSLSSLETKHVAATKSLLFYPVAWPMDTYNMYMQLHFYMSHLYLCLLSIIICTHAGCNVGCGNLLNYLGLCVCVCVCERECVCVIPTGMGEWDPHPRGWSNSPDYQLLILIQQ